MSAYFYCIMTDSLLALKTGDERLALTFHNVYNHKGVLVKNHIHLSKIEVTSEMNYKEALAFCKKDRASLSERETRVYDLMYNFLSLSDLINKRRLDKGMIHLPVWNHKLVLGNTPQELTLQKSSGKLVIRKYVDNLRYEMDEIAAQFIHKNYTTVYS